ncbi:hypothetical protein PR001_g24496 [Phytophthora rubi]|uniref:Uncharacterized protein n=1 Tax=Phytophthora rubi TaxID=129364 RepID=A0A6A3IGH9_9STRA|nr:hypothetical protein PR002_g24842 [Phytophthora rubi]KAE8979625.1 hypothetical protein PR001_g24496 [Phytophthora rubi]
MVSSSPASFTPVTHPVPATTPDPSPTPSPSVPAAAFTAARKRTIAELAEACRQKKHLDVNQEVAAAATAFATVLPRPSEEPSAAVARLSLASPDQGPPSSDTSGALSSASVAVQSAPRVNSYRTACGAGDINGAQLRNADSGIKSAQDGQCDQGAQIAQASEGGEHREVRDAPGGSGFADTTVNQPRGDQHCARQCVREAIRSDLDNGFRLACALTAEDPPFAPPVAPFDTSQSSAAPLGRPCHSQP